MITYAFSKFNICEPKLFQAITDKSKDIIDKYSDFQLRTVLQACAAVRHACPQFLEVAGDSLVDRIQNMRLAYLQQIVWSYAMLGHTHEKLFDAILEQAATKIKAGREFSREDVFMIYFSLGILQHYNQRFFDVGVDWVLEESDKLNMLNWATVLWSLSTVAQKQLCQGNNSKARKLQEHLDALFACSRPTLVQKCGVLNGAGLTNLAYSLLNTRTDFPDVMDRIADTIIKKQEYLRPQDLGVLLSIFADMNYVHSDMVKAVRDTFVNDESRDYFQRVMLQLIWGMAFFDMHDDAEFWKKAVLKIQTYDPQCMDKEKLGKLYQVHLLNKLDENDNFNLEQLPYGFYEVVTLHQQSENAKRKAENMQFVNQVCELFPQVEIAGYIMQELPDDQSFIDVAIQSQNGQKFAIMFEDYDAFYASNLSKPLGQLAMQNRILYKMGFEPISILKNEWTKMSIEEQRGHLRTLLFQNYDQNGELPEQQQQISQQSETSTIDYNLNDFSDEDDEDAEEEKQEEQYGEVAVN
eukprot:TRINITY_DN1128_c2_g1_i2.p1 TRINITY_DN1128_c2_g1~~TRINITY_DN1128_c2_g1_i2.p1  ORF type:complete len:523 (-),score=74.55 TRINITY_DN1128_c2_g1_i2:587-2155(-)